MASNAAKLSEACPDRHLPGFFRKLQRDRSRFQIPLLVEAVLVGDRKLWAIVVAWEYEVKEVPDLGAGHIGVYMLDANSGKQLAHRTCG
jgi:hypothetical protein